MGIASATATGLVALLHGYILVLEMFLWTRPAGLRAFGQRREFAVQTRALAANQGLYNGFLAAGLAWGVAHPSPAFAAQLRLFFLACVAVAGIYGARTVNCRILQVQTLPAAIAAALVLLGL